jgi:hypothetical protein
MIFRPELAAKIVKGQKTATRRAMNPAKVRSPWHPDSHSYPVGRAFAVCPGRGVHGIAQAIVTARRIEPLSAVTPHDARCEGFPTRDGFVAAWRAINGDWDPDERVHVVEFELAGPDCRDCDGQGLTVRSLALHAPLVPCPDCFGTGSEVSPAARELIDSLGL